MKKKRQENNMVSVTAYYNGYVQTETITEAEAKEKYTSDKFDTIEQGDGILVVRLKSAGE